MKLGTGARAMQQCYSPLDGSPSGSPSHRERQLRTHARSRRRAGLIAAVVCAALLLAGAAQYRRNREWQKHGCALKILSKTAGMKQTFQVGAPG